MDLTEKERLLMKLCSKLDSLTEAIEQQNKLLNDIIYYPSDQTEPPRLLIATCGAVEVIDL